MENHYNNCPRYRTNDLEEIKKLHGGLFFYQGYDSIGDESGYEGEEPNAEIEVLRGAGSCDQKT